MVRPRFFLPLLTAVFCSASLGADSWAPKLVFTGEPVQLHFEGLEGSQVVELSLITQEEESSRGSVSLEFENGKAEWVPQLEGIYRARVEGREVRGLAMNPPSFFDKEALLATLPRQGPKLLSGEPYTLYAMGDSVTATGDYPTMLAMLLRRATGNDQVVVVERAYPGCSNDASVRNWWRDSQGVQPDLALIMYGLNDEGARVPLPAYVEQTEWLVEHLRKDFAADVMLLEPTPDTGMVLPSRAGEIIEPSKIFRTQAFAAALRDWADAMEVPVVDTFDALWGEGAGNLVAVGRKLWPMFPLHYSKPFTSLIENEGRGDTIHPNALGHLALARAAYARIMGIRPEERLQLLGKTRWSGETVETVVEVVNRTDQVVRGRLQFYPVSSEPPMGEVGYELHPGERTEVIFPWTGIQRPADLLEPRFAHVFRRPGPYAVVVDQWSEGNSAQGIRIPWEPAVFFPLQRYVTESGDLSIQMQVGDVRDSISVTIPDGSDVGRIPLVEEVTLEEGAPSWAVGEVAYTRFGAARSMEVRVDGDLEEWAGSSWVPVGESVQARWTRGPLDLRETEEDCYLEWSFAAGEKGVFLAFRGRANARGDRFDVYFDPRDPDELGTVGPYTWVSGSFRPDGSLQVRAGDSSMDRTGILSVYREEEGGLLGEVFVPYATMDAEGWPKSGDLGLSIVWAHRVEGESSTYLMWAEEGHPWNARWYGVVRLDPVGPLPYRVRVK